MEKLPTVMMELSARDMQVFNLAMEASLKLVKKYAKQEARASSFLNSNCFGELLEYEEGLMARLKDKMKEIPPHIPKGADDGSDS